VRFLFPPGRAKAPSPLQWQGPSPLPQRQAGIRTGWGPKAPGQRPPRHRRAPLAHRVGRWPLCRLDLPVYEAPFRAGGETRCVSCSRPDGRSCVLRDARSLWQGPSPLPQCCAGIRTGRGPKPPASPRPAPTASARPPAGASRPPGRALASVPPGPAGLQGTVPRGRGKRGSRFPVPPERDNPFPRIRRVPTGRRPDYNFGTLLSPQGCCGNPPVRMCRRQGAGRSGRRQRIGKKPETGRTGA